MEDVWELIEPNSRGEMVIDVQPMYVCRANCGYMKLKEEMPEVIAQQGDDRLLLYSNEEARVLDVRQSILWPPMHVQSLLARGYWEDYDGDEPIETLLEGARDSRSFHMESPNLFRFATSELSQDAFLCWLISWAAPYYRSLDRPLFNAATEFVSTVFNAHQVPVPAIKTIDIKRQFRSLDILVIVNDSHAILIEDKTYTKDHSNQLQRYRDSVKETYPHLKQLPIYFKITDQSQYRSVVEAGYVPFKRTTMLRILKNGLDNGVKNAIFLDYHQHLQQIDDRISAYRTKQPAEWDAYAWQGFYQEIQKEIDGEWNYVSNQTGGFWAFWWKSVHSDRWYLQLEQEKICAKIVVEEADKRAEERVKAIASIRELSEMQDLQLEKPARLGNGKTMTIAQRFGYLQLNEDGMVDMEQTIVLLKRY